MVVGPPTNPWPAKGMTPLAIMPGAKRANSTGMFDWTGSSAIFFSLSTNPCLSVVTSSNGASPVTVISSSMAPISSVSCSVSC